MSKASEWAKAAHALTEKEAGRFEAEGLSNSIANEGRAYNVCLSVGRRNAEPTMSWTDYRTGGVTLSAHAALSMARWILDTFGETK